MEDTTPTYKALVDCLRVAASEEGHAINRAYGPSAPIMDGALQGCLVPLVGQDLPSWNNPQMSGERAANANTGPANSSMPSRLETLLAEILLAQQPQGAPVLVAGNGEKLPSETYRKTIDVLPRLTQQRSEQSLPPLWHAWSNCEK